MEYVYHGSANKHIEKFEPRVSPGNEKYGAHVYASPSKAAASVFMADVGKPWSAGVVNGALCAIIPLTREEFMRRDNGGCIYTFSAETFSSDAERNLGDLEWASSVAVSPVDKTEYSSVLDAMLQNGVRVCFVDDGMLEKYVKADGREKARLLEELKAETISSE